MSAAPRAPLVIANETRAVMIKSVFTILGADGFIGGHLAAALRARSIDVSTPSRDTISTDAELGHVIYCIGLTADFRRRPLDAMEAHVCRLLELVRHARFASLLYLSSTRVYGSDGIGCETRSLTVEPSKPDQLYNISKMAGESVCLSDPRETIRVVRLSNVYGPDMPEANFLSQVVASAVNDGHVSISESADSCKDYIAVSDVCRALIRIVQVGSHRLYNVASGNNVSHGELLAALERQTGCGVSIANQAPRRSFSPIAVDRLVELFESDSEGPWMPQGLLADLESLASMNLATRGSEKPDRRKAVSTRSMP